MKSMLRSCTIAALPFAVAACSSMGIGGGSGDIPAAIAVPSGHRLVLTLQGSGLQNYECRAKADAAGGYDWVFVAPEAALKDKAGAIVGRHFAGPTWEHGDGSSVKGKVLATSAAPQAGNIPWLVLQATPAGTPGAFNGVTYIQRTNTSGGTAPSDTCSASTAGAKKGVTYKADYLFYKS